MTQDNLSRLEPTEDSHVYIPQSKTDYRSFHTGKVLKTINNPNPEMEIEVENIINLPPFCTATNNPGPGSTLTVRYKNTGKLLEVFTFERYINSFIGHKLVRDVEFLTQEIAREVATVLQADIEVEAFYALVGFTHGQGVTTKIRIKAEQAKRYLAEYPAKWQEYQDREALKNNMLAQRQAQPTGTVVRPGGGAAAAIAALAAANNAKAANSAAEATTAQAGQADDDFDPSAVLAQISGETQEHDLQKCPFLASKQDQEA